MPTPHTVQQGECFSSLASQYSCPWKVLWNHPLALAGIHAGCCEVFANAQHRFSPRPESAERRRERDGTLPARSPRAPARLAGGAQEVRLLPAADGAVQDPAQRALHEGGRKPGRENR